MDFINNPISNALILLFSIASLVNAIFSIVWYRKSKQKES